MINKIIAVDFDGTLVSNEYPDIGTPIEKVINLCKMEQANGTKLILWTCRTGKHLDDAVELCNSFELYFDAINENLPEMIEFFGGDTRKIFATEYWDDRAVKMPPEGIPYVGRNGVYRQPIMAIVGRLNNES